MVERFTPQYARYYPFMPVWSHMRGPNRQMARGDQQPDTKETTHETEETNTRNLRPVTKREDMPKPETANEMPKDQAKPDTGEKEPNNVFIPEEDMDGMDEMDLAQMLKMYPKISKEIYKYVKMICDTLDKEGSMMYDEVMDKESILRLVEKIFKMIMEEHAKDSKRGAMPRGYYGGLYKDMIHTILLNEMYGHRRRRHRRRHRRYPCYKGCHHYPYY